jgi:hypothetical protein
MVRLRIVAIVGIAVALAQAAACSDASSVSDEAGASATERDASVDSGGSGGHAGGSGGSGGGGSGGGGSGGHGVGLGGSDGGMGGAVGTAGMSAGGAGGAGAGGVAAGGVGGVAGAPVVCGLELAPTCPVAYDLPQYSGDTSDLCHPAESSQCACDAAAAVAPQCTPDGEACILMGATCYDCYPVDAPECGWIQDARLVVCPELYQAANDGGAIGRPCASDAECESAHACSVRVANRMFCDDVVVFRAADFCPG